MQSDKPIKVYVSVSVMFGTDGRIIPRTLVWEDGQSYKIDKVIDCKPAAAMRAGGQGDRYTVRIGGKERYIYFERGTDLTGTNLGKWFVERQAS